MLVILQSSPQMHVKVFWDRFVQWASSFWEVVSDIWRLAVIHISTMDAVAGGVWIFLHCGAHRAETVVTLQMWWDTLDQSLTLLNGGSVGVKTHKNCIHCLTATFFKQCFPALPEDLVSTHVAYFFLLCIGSCWHSSHCLSSSTSDYKPLVPHLLSPPPRLCFHQSLACVNTGYIVHREAFPNCQRLDHEGSCCDVIGRGQTSSLQELRN